MERIWPFRDLLGVLSHKVVLAENKQRAVDCQAALSDWYGVVQGHGAGSLGHRLLVHPWCWRTALPAATAARSPLAGAPATVPGRHFVSKARHSVDTKRQWLGSSREGGDNSGQAHHITPHQSLHKHTHAKKKTGLASLDIHGERHVHQLKKKIAKQDQKAQMYV